MCPGVLRMWLELVWVLIDDVKFRANERFQDGLLAKQELWQPCPAAVAVGPAPISKEEWAYWKWKW